MHGYPHFFSKKLYRKGGRETSKNSAKKKRTLSIVSKEGKVEQKPQLRDTLRSEYASNFTEKSSIRIKKKRAQTARRDSTSEGVWTRDSIVNVNRMKQPESFAELIEGKYQSNYMESQKEKDRVNYLDRNFKSGNPRIFRNFIDTNTNVLRRQMQTRKMESMRASEESE